LFLSGGLVSIEGLCCKQDALELKFEAEHDDDDGDLVTQHIDEE
jgi:hypothetical protein